VNLSHEPGSYMRTIAIARTNTPPSLPTFISTYTQFYSRIAWNIM
jgi:hypothetical protein